MKTLCNFSIRLTFFLSVFFGLGNESFAQGRVVINEFMPWSGCNTTSEFVELMNFGPGPMDIGCYIVTNGQYSVTIPPNTVINPGKYFVISGQNSLTQGCGNIDSTVQVDLNWTTCNCSNTTIPTTGDGFFANGGSSNEKVVLLSPNLTVLDAVSRSSTPSTSNAITTPSLSGSCTSRTFDLDTMNVAYESIGISTGIDNSYARRVDGDCGWVKTTEISADAANKTGSTSSATYSFSTLSASQCNGSTGSISITVTASNVAALFPMTYTLAYDKDSNNVFNSNDNYYYGVDSSASTIDISNLAYGRYRITVGSASGCNLQSFDFFIFNCYGVVLSYKIKSFVFNGAKDGNDWFAGEIQGVGNLQAVILEGGNGSSFLQLKQLDDFTSVNETFHLNISLPASSYTVFRLKIIDKNNIVSYSREIKISRPESIRENIWPNPSRKEIFIKFNSESNGYSDYIMYNSFGTVVRRTKIRLTRGLNIVRIEISDLKPGNYHLAIEGRQQETLATFRFLRS
jgi:hypothetical protein